MKIMRRGTAYEANQHAGGGGSWSGIRVGRREPEKWPGATVSSTSSEAQAAAAEIPLSGNENGGKERALQNHSPAVKNHRTL